mgnify:CR=1 FL=1
MGVFNNILLYHIAQRISTGLEYFSTDNYLFNNRLFDLNRDGKVDIFEKAFVYHTLFEDDDKNVSRNDDYDDDDCDECDCDDCDDDFYDF